MLEMKDKCTGCAVCSAVCPHNCIVMLCDEEGFQSPHIDETKCVGCGLCEKKCPINNRLMEERNKPLFYAMKNSSEIQRLSSASGGVFPELAKYIISRRGLVWGASFNNQFLVNHEYVDNIGDLHKLCRSKYVQSDTRGIYQKVMMQLHEGKEVLFSGTPCQVTALANYVGPSLSSKLFLVELICHGVPSPKIWNDFKRCLCEENGERVEKIESVSFKYKDSKYGWLRSGFRMTWMDKKEYLDYANASWYENGFLNNLYVRPSCHDCKFKSFTSTSDIMIGDFWGCDRLYPNFYDPKGVSVICLKTKKGRELFNAVKYNFDFIEVCEEDACKHNQRIMKPASVSIKRKTFWNRYFDACQKKVDMNTMEKIVSECSKLTWYDYIHLYFITGVKKICRMLRKPK